MEGPRGWFGAAIVGPTAGGGDPLGIRAAGGPDDADGHVDARHGAAAVAGAAEAATAWDLQLQPGDAGALSTLLPAIAADGASIGVTSVPGLYVVQGSAAAMGALGRTFAASPGVVYAGPEHILSAAAAPNDPDYTNGNEWQLNGTWGINAPGRLERHHRLRRRDRRRHRHRASNYNHPDISTTSGSTRPRSPSTVRPNLTDVNDDGLITFADLNNSGQPGHRQDRRHQRRRRDHRRPT